MWKYVHAKTKAEIIVNDATSAAHLALVLAEVAPEWQLARKPVRPPAAPVPVRTKRRFPRYAARFRIILITQHHSFRTYSREISLGGMRLEREIPQAFLRSPFKVFIGHQNAAENIEINCNVIANDPGNPMLVRFVDAAPASLETLDKWIRAGLRAA